LLAIGGNRSNVYPMGYALELKMARIFRSNRSQALRLPKAAEFPPDVSDVDVLVEGERRVLVPKRRGWAQYFASRQRLSANFPQEIPDLPAEPIEPCE
jgi:antitoxin VapB